MDKTGEITRDKTPDVEGVLKSKAAADDRERLNQDLTYRLQQRAAESLPAPSTAKAKE